MRTPPLDAPAGPLYWFPLTVLRATRAKAPRDTWMPFWAIIRPRALSGPAPVTSLPLTQADDPGASMTIPAFWEPVPAVAVIVARTVKSSVLKAVKPAVGQCSRPTSMPTPVWQPYRLGSASLMSVTASCATSTLAPSMTRMPYSSSAQPPPGSGPAIARPRIVTWTPRPQTTTMACGAARSSAANWGGSGSADGAHGLGAAIVAPGRPVSVTDLVTTTCSRNGVVPHR